MASAQARILDADHISLIRSPMPDPLGLNLHVPISRPYQQQWTLMEPVHVQVHAKEAMPSCLSHFYVVCPPEQKLPVLRALIKREFGSLRGVQASGTEADTRGLVFALPAKPLEEIASSLDRALGGNGHENGRDRTEPLLAEFLREELGLNARVREQMLVLAGCF